MSRFWKKVMEKSVLATLILFPGFILSSQDTKITKEINEQAWMTFIRFFRNGDAEQFKSVHSRDAVRVIQDDGQIFSYDQYFKKIPDSYGAK